MCICVCVMYVCVCVMCVEGEHAYGNQRTTFHLLGGSTVFSGNCLFLFHTRMLEWGQALRVFGVTQEMLMCSSS